MSSLEISDLHFRHIKDTRWILEDLTLRLRDGETAMLVGDNGSGKSTLGKLIAGLNRQERGRISIDGRESESIAIAERARHVVYMGQTSYLQFFRPSIREEIRFAAKLAGSKAHEGSYVQFRLPEDGNVKPMDLAYPAMWRLQLFLFSMVFKPSVLFVDEIVAPGARAQIDALKTTLDEREREGLITILAYQRPLALLEGRKVRRFDLTGGRLHEV
jgi:energy-coupling factor transporter ATP-binding protein EcfA2